MRKLWFLLALLVVGAISTSAQTVVLSATFTFDGTTPCSDITSWNGVPDAYPDDMGTICLNQGDPYGGPGSYLDVPFQLGFLNNGYLAECNALAWGQKTFTIGDGTHTGDAFTWPASTTCPNYTTPSGLSVGFSIVASYTVVKHQACRYGRCITYYTSVLQGGTGTVGEMQN